MLGRCAPESFSFIFADIGFHKMNKRGCGMTRQGRKRLMVPGSSKTFFKGRFFWATAAMVVSVNNCLQDEFGVAAVTRRGGSGAFMLYLLQKNPLS